MFSQTELRLMWKCVKTARDQGLAALSSLDEDSDEYVEKANDLMVLDTLLSKIEDSLS